MSLSVTEKQVNKILKCQHFNWQTNYGFTSLQNVCFSRLFVTWANITSSLTDGNNAKFHTISKEQASKLKNKLFVILWKKTTFKIIFFVEEYIVSRFKIKNLDIKYRMIKFCKTFSVNCTKFIICLTKILTILEVKGSIHESM